MGGAEYLALRDDLVDRLITLAQSDERIVGLWLQGSLADGTDDTYSDIDAYIAVQDDLFGNFRAERSRLGGALGTVLVEMDNPALNATHFVFGGLLKLDLFMERYSSIDQHTRPAVKVLYDGRDVGQRLRTGGTASPDEVRQRIEMALLGTLQGAAWPLRLVGRDQWATLVFAEMFVIIDTIALLMAVQIDLQFVRRNRFSLPRLLSRDQRAVINSLTAGVLRAAIERRARLALEAHLRILDELFEQGRRGCDAASMPYPLSEEAEAQLRQAYLDQWPTEPG
ncbi:MAG: hypothetical protein WEB00_11820 [Dehalococcoidia bacterium]